MVLLPIEVILSLMFRLEMLQLTIIIILPYTVVSVKKIPGYPITVFGLWSLARREGVNHIMSYTWRLLSKGVLFQALSI